MIAYKVKNSGELVTKYTLPAEKLTGATINTDITIYEMEFKNKPNFDCTPWLEESVYGLNIKAKELLEEVIEFKSIVLKEKIKCKLGIMIYPEMLDHVIEEAELYMKILDALISKESMDESICNSVNFWNHIMLEHGEFIDGLLDPSEKALKDRAEDFVEAYEKLVAKCIDGNMKIVRESRALTGKFRDFKASATDGLINYNIKSNIPAILADHVLREANHYLRLLRR